MGGILLQGRRSRRRKRGRGRICEWRRCLRATLPYGRVSDGSWAASFCKGGVRDDASVGGSEFANGGDAWERRFLAVAFLMGHGRHPFARETFATTQAWAGANLRMEAMLESDAPLRSRFG